MGFSAKPESDPIPTFPRNADFLSVSSTCTEVPLNSVFLLCALILCLLVPQLRTWALPLSLALYLINPLLLLAAAVLGGGALLWRTFR